MIITNRDTIWRGCLITERERERPSYTTKVLTRTLASSYTMAGEDDDPGDAAMPVPMLADASSFFFLERRLRLRLLYSDHNYCSVKSARNTHVSLSRARLSLLRLGLQEPKTDDSQGRRR